MTDFSDPKLKKAPVAADAFLGDPKMPIDNVAETPTEAIADAENSALPASLQEALADAQRCTTHEQRKAWCAKHGAPSPQWLLGYWQTMNAENDGAEEIEPVAKSTALQGSLGGRRCTAALLVVTEYRKGAGGEVVKWSRPKSGQANVQTVFELHDQWHGVVALNEFTGDIVKRKAPPTLRHERPRGDFEVSEWTESDTARAKSWFAKNLGFEPENHQIEAALRVAAERNRFHPVREYLGSLKWDGAPRLDTWLARYMGSREDAYTSAVGAQLLIGACARVYQPGCKLDTVVVFEGAQGKRKSTACGVLAGEDWFSDTALDIGSKDAMQGMRGNWFIELAELASIKSARALEGMKGFLTSRTDDYRPSYGRRNQKHKRQCVFLATHNPDGTGYLVDPTGNRRFLPVECGDIDIDGLRQDRDQLFAEAVVRYRAGERWWLEGEAQSIAADEQAARGEEDPWMASVAGWLAVEPPSRLKAGITTADVLSEALGLNAHQHDRRAASRVGVILSSLGWKAKGKARPRRYFNA